MKTCEHLQRSLLLIALCLMQPALAQDQAAQNPLVVQEIRCTGNFRTSCEFIRDHLYLRVGDVLDEDEIRSAELRLAAQGNFEAVRVSLEKGARRGAVQVVIDVTESAALLTEWMLGGSSRLDAHRVVLGGRVANQNLFGTGKFLDLSALAVLPVGGKGQAESYDVVLRYADPHLFSSRRWFGMASASYRKSEYSDGRGNESFSEFPQFSLSLGRRFGDFSYLVAGVSYRPGLKWQYARWDSSGQYIISSPEDDYEFNSNIAYGWSNEDDLHFPTQGSTFQLAAGGDYGSRSPYRRSHVQFRKTWPVGDAYWTLKVGGDPSPEYRNSFDESQFLSMTYARPLAGGAEVKRGRWYIEPGINSIAFSSTGDSIVEAGLKIGWRLDTRSFGVIDLYLIGSGDVAR
jgi:outer membrane protein assembly factor BamA